MRIAQDLQDPLRSADSHGGDRHVRLVAVVAASLLLTFALGACSSRLVVQERFQEDAECSKDRTAPCTGYRLTAGIPVYQQRPAIEYFVLKAHSKLEQCRPVVRARRTLAAVGNPQYLSIDSMPFATASLTVKYTASGAVEQIAFNTEPSGEAVDAATSALSTLLPFVGITSDDQPAPLESASQDQEAEESRELPICDSGEISVEVVPVEGLDPRNILDRADDLPEQLSHT